MANWIIALALMCVVFPANAMGQTQDTLVGTWKLNVAKSKSSPGPPAKSNRITISAPQGGWAGVTDGIDAAGKPTHTEITAKFDGKDYPLKGVAPNTTRAFANISSSSVFGREVGGDSVVGWRVADVTDGRGCKRRDS